MRCNNTCITGISEGEEKKKGIENLFEKIMRKIFPKLVREIVIQVQEGQRVTIKMNAKRHTPRQIIIKMAILKTKRTS